MLFGDKPILCCVIKCNGQGPVVNISPSDVMDFGETKLLKEELRSFSLINESPIPANLVVAIVRTHPSTSH